MSDAICARFTALERVSHPKPAAVKNMITLSPAAGTAISVLPSSVVRPAVAPSTTDRAIMGYAMQDAARQAAYGTGCLKYHLEHQPGQKNAMNEYLDETEHVILGILASPELLEPMIIISFFCLAPDPFRAGLSSVSRMIRLSLYDYLERLEYAGLEGRSRRCLIPRVIYRVQRQA